MQKSLDNYVGFVGRETIDELYTLAEPLKQSRIYMINSTKTGGGVAELLSSLVPLFNDLGIQTYWLTLHGNPNFFSATKSFHNALQGDPSPNIEQRIQDYGEFYDNEFTALNQSILESLDGLNNSDFVIIHDPQPLALVKYRKNDGSKWIWRKHIDTGNPNPALERYIYALAEKYDKIITSRDHFRRGDTEKYEVIQPSIDPLNAKNRELAEQETKAILQNHNIPADKPYLSQISRLDKWKDPVGVIEAFRKARGKANFRLFLIYNGATDDPEGSIMEEKVLNAKKGDYEDDIMLIRGDDPELVNALQRSSAAVIQKSLREGFALTVSEALWKGVPVIATDVGGIPAQVNGANGYLVKGYEIDSEGNPLNSRERQRHLSEISDCMLDSLNNPEKTKEMGRQGKEHVRKNFLITRHLKQYLQLLSRHL